MRFPVYVTLSPGGDRPYVSTTPPSKEAMEYQKTKGCEFYEGFVEIPGWEFKEAKLIRTAPLIESVDVRKQSVSEF